VFKGKLGELLVSLCYQPTAECITVIVARARELKAKDINGLSGAFMYRIHVDLLLLQQLHRRLYRPHPVQGGPKPTELYN